MMACKKLQILVEQASLERFSEIVEDCRRAGMVIERQMRSVGVFSGFVEETRLGDIYNIAGVREVEEARDVHGLVSPDSGSAPK
ncbi:MAG TPA: hypothetical protein VIR76_05460 [Pusillimonas sp.]